MAGLGILDRLFRSARRRSGIEAAGGGRRWDGAPSLHAPATSALAARGPAQARAAALYVNSPLAHRAVEAWVAALIGGKGWQARSGHPDADARRADNAAFEALIAPILTVAARALVRDGEAFVRLAVDGEGAMRPRCIPAAQVDPAMTQALSGGRRIVAGVELDRHDDPVAYHILPSGDAPFADFGPPVRVPAADMLHVFDRLFPGQVRGLSALAPVLLKLRDRDEAADAMLMQLKVAALMTGYVTDPEGGTAGLGEAAGGAVNLALEPGAMRILPPGADVRFSQPGQGLAQAVDFLRAQDREIAAGLGLTFEALTGDMAESSYSSARMGLLEFRRRAEMLQRAVVEAQLLRPLWRRWQEARALAGEIGADDLPDRLAVRFVAPGWPWVDPYKDVNAEKLAVEAGFKSRAEVIAARGRDPDEVAEEIAAEAAGGAA